jgi:hypothetical protein
MGSRKIARDVDVVQLYAARCPEVALVAERGVADIEFLGV